MSAIWGVWNRGGSNDAGNAVARMTAVLSIFGSTACWNTAQIALGRAIAHTLPQDAGDTQPVQLANGDILVASVRLDARDSLASTLGCEAHIPDSQVVAAAWLRWGEECPRHLTGDFAFAVWQPRRRQLFCARDPLGMRSFYYAATPTQFAFATLPRAIHAAGAASRELDPDALAATLAAFPEKPDGTLFKGILRLPAGHSLTVTARGTHVARYWNPAGAAPLRYSSDEEYAEAFRGAFDTAVRDRLRSAVPVGAMLSGGFDSTSVTASAASLLASRGLALPAFTGVPDPAFTGPVAPTRFADESGHAAAVAALYPNIRHTLVTPLPGFPLDLALSQFPRTDAPGSGLCLAPNGAAMAAAHRAAGVGVLLNGVTGNLTISYNGLPLIPQLAQRRQWRQWFRESRSLVERAHFRWPGVLALSFGPQAPPFLWKWVQRRRTGAGSGLARHAILSPRYLATGRIRQLAEERAFDPFFRPSADGRGLRVQLLMQRNNAIHNAAAEFRDPTADKRLIEFCLSAPENQFLRNGTTKFLLRNAMRKRLPAIVLNEWRKGLCGADWALRIAPYRDRFQEALTDIAQSPLARECLDLPRLQTMIDHWPADWSTGSVQTEYRMGFCQAIQAGAFIRWVESSR